ncbi:MAG: carboxypeptidase-like regulatory domain-containing protein [Flavobacteriales bacterium]|nr:MAG: carboxypeptidase-like regulatory domain-containing protein [Flavobacteriales bacterium]
MLRLLLLPIAAWPLLAGAQERIAARVVDASTGAPLMHATVAIIGTGSGTITNADGAFALALRTGRDSLRISYVGYRTVRLPFSAALHGASIALTRSPVELAALEVRPEADLYKRVARAAGRLRRAPEAKAKAYYNLQTHSDGEPVERLQACYTAQYRGGGLRSLAIKQGRIGIAPKEDRHFINFNTAGALLLLDPFGGNGRLPVSPLSFTSGRQLRQHYTVRMVAASAGPDDGDHLRAEPIDGNGLRLDLWLDPVGDAVHALELHCRNCRRHPFVPLFKDGRIDSVSLRYRQTWSLDTPAMPQLIELDYSMRYTGPGISDRFTTRAVLHAFETGEGFVPVLFPWRTGLEEYPSMAWLPVDTAFWQRQELPVPAERLESDEAFIQQHEVARNNWFAGIGQQQYDLRPPYRIWSDGARIDSLHISGSPRVVVPGSGRKPAVHLRTHLYLDLDTAGGALRHRSFAVFSGRESWHSTPWSPASAVLTNLFFDLAEAERRAMELRLQVPGMTLARAREIHAEHTRRMRQEQERLLRYGLQDSIHLLAWNRRIRESLGIDNVERLLRFAQPQAPPPFEPAITR